MKDWHKKASNVSSRKKAIALGRADGEECALECLRDAVLAGTETPDENPEGWAQWGDYASEAASLGGVSDRWRRVYVQAFEREAGKVVAAWDAT